MQGYAAGFAAEYDQAVLDKDLPQTQEEILDDKWADCAKTIKEEFVGEIETWFWGNMSTHDCVK